MKNNAQAILLLTGHPLEPIVALEVQKSLQARLVTTANADTSASTPIHISTKRKA